MGLCNRSERRRRNALRTPRGAAASRHITASGEPAHSCRDLLDHLATLTRQAITIGGHQIEKITSPTPARRQAFDLLSVPILITLE